MVRADRARHLKVVAVSLHGGNSDQFALGPADHERELADLRYFWGGAYRITWQGRFRATHIRSGEAVEADTATSLRELLFGHQCRHGHDT